MAKIEPFPCAIALPRDDGESLRPAGTRLSIAARFEEPDLRSFARDGYAEGMTRSSERVTLPDLRAEKSVYLSTGNAFILAKAEGPLGTSIALYCHYPAKAIKELFGPAASEIPEVDPDYLQLLRDNGAVLDPLHIAVAGLDPAELTKILDFGSEVAEQTISEGVRVTYREIRDSKEVKVLHKLFDPAFFARSEPFLLDGPFALGKWQVNNRREHVYACVIPIAKGFGQLTLGEMIWDRREVPAPVPEPVEGDEDAPKPLPAPLKLPDGLRLLRHYYSSEASRDYAQEDFQEDLTIESKVADVCALLTRDRDEFGVVIGERSRYPLPVAGLFAKGAMLPDAQRVIVEGETRAAQLFAAEYGFAAAWMPRREGVDYGDRILLRRPSMLARRAMVRLSTPIPFGSVIRVGL
ncbi:MAG: hypothetical protein KDB07_02240 [Planctomycetes bacterium]|nr:hypothetical protein [Planctomycetota bacterium]